MAGGSWFKRNTNRFGVVIKISGTEIINLI